MGEVRHWSPTLFNSSPGGGGAFVGITWLAFTVIMGTLFGSIATAIFSRRNIGIPAQGRA